MTLLKRSIGLPIFLLAAPALFAQAPTITSISPVSGRVGTSVSIAGANFDPVATNDIVFFGGVKGSVTSATSTLITAKVPLGASYAPLSVSVNGLAGYSRVPFDVTFTGGATLSPPSYLPKSDLTTGILPYGVAIGDLDGDGKPDIVVANNTSGTISVYRNIGSRDSLSASSFAQAVEFTAGANPWGVAIADLDGDGKPDIAVSNSPGGVVSVFRNTSLSGTIDASSFAARVTFATGGSGYGIAIADLDGDGKPDIVATNRNASTVSILRNTGSPGTLSFASNVDFATGPLPYGVVTGDLDGDGKPDIVVANNGEDSLSVLLNTSSVGSITNSSFVPGAALAASGAPIAVGFAEVNGDGKPDIISANAGDSTIEVFQNNSSVGSLAAGSFAAGVGFNLSSAPTAIAIADLNGDGRPDIVVANENSDKLSIFQNLNPNGAAVGPGSFGSEVDLATGAKPYGLAVDDFNGDGRPDLTASNSGVNTLSVFASIVGAPTISLSGPSVLFGLVALHDSTTLGLVVKDLSGDTLVVDSMYVKSSGISLSKTGGTTTDSLSVLVTFHATVTGVFSDTIVVLSNAKTPLVEVPVAATVYAWPGRPLSASVNPSGWSNAAAFTVSWTNPSTGMLPVRNVWYSVDTLPDAATHLGSQSVTGTSASIPVKTVGTDTLYFFLEDSLGNKNADSTAFVIVRFDNNPPALTQNNATLDTIFVQLDGTLSAIPPVVSSASEPANESGIMTHQLLYRRLDEQVWTTLNFASDTLAVPTSSFILNGMVVGAEYRVQASDSAGNTSLSNLLAFNVRYKANLSAPSLTAIPSIHSLNLAAGQEVKAYRIFSVPYDPADERPASLIDASFGPHADKGVPYVYWRMERYVNAGWIDYDSFKDSSDLVPGAGFFVVTENAPQTGSLSAPLLARADRMYYTGVRLNAGWNLVGNPFLVNVPFAHLVFQGGTPLAHYFFSGTGSQGGWEGSGADVDTLRSWQGMAIKMDSASTLTFDLAGMQTSQLSRQVKGGTMDASHKVSSKSPTGWTISIDAERDDLGIVCNGTEVGMSSGAGKGIDPLDKFQAPFVGARNLIVSSQNDAGPLVKDFRPQNSDGESWDLLVRTGDPFAKATLSFNLSAELSNLGFHAALIAYGEGMTYDLLHEPSVRVTTGGDGTGKYRLLVGTAAFIKTNDDGAPLIPTTSALFPNYPNPFNPTTTIRYAVPGTLGSGTVDLKVYNILGQEVATLVHGSAVPGYHEAQFDGSRLSSGIYFCRLMITAEGATFHDTKKMVLIR